MTMLYAQFTHSIGLNDVCDALRLHSGPLSAIRGATPPSRNGLSHASKERKAALVEKLFWAALGHLQSLSPGFGHGRRGKGVTHRFRKTIHIVDSTTIELVASCMDWAKHRRRKAAAKCHMRLDLQSFLPRFVLIDTARDADPIFLAELHRYLVSPTDVDAYLHHADDTLLEKERLLESRMRDAEQVRKEGEKTYRLYQAGQIETESFGKFFKPIEERQKQLDEEIPRLQGEIDFLKANALSSRQVMADAHDLQSRWPHLDKDEKRTIVECITSRIIIRKDEIAIELCYLPPSGDLSKREWSLGDSNP